MSLSKHGSVQSALAIIAIVAAVGAYCELESALDPLERASAVRPSAAASAAAPRDARSEAAPGLPIASSRGAADERAIAAPDLVPPLARSDAAARKPRRDADERVDEKPAEDPVTTAAGMLAARLESEPFDPKWSRDAESRLLEHFAALAGGAVAEARCRSSVCRLELAFESEAARDDGLAALTLPWDSVGVYQMDEADPRNLILYATRQPEDVLPRG